MNETTLFIIILGGLFLIEIGFFISKIISNKKREVKEADGWLDESELSFSKDEMKNIRIFSKDLAKKDAFSIDTITWNDLELDALYNQMNTCFTVCGDFTLYNALKYPETDKETIDKRKKIMKWAKENPEERDKVRYCLSIIRRNLNVGLKTAFTGSTLEGVSNYLAIFLSILFLLSLIGSCFIPACFTLVLVVGLVNNFIVSSHGDKKIVKQMENTMQIMRCIRGLSYLASFDWNKEIKDELGIDNQYKILKEIDSSMFIELYSGTNIFSLILTQLFLGELISYNNLVEKIKRHRADIYRMYRTIGLLDSCIAVSAYMERNDVCAARFTQKKEVHAKSLYHPYIRNAVSNDVDIDNCVLITGSNATGKSSFLKAVAISTLTAQSYGFAFAKSFTTGYFHLYTSMALKDNLFANESYFITEIKALKRIMDAVENKEPVLCMVDEILKGTNTAQRIAASSEILKILKEKHALCISATHDLELTQILKNDYTMKHFSEEWRNDDLHFDYLLKDGPTKTRNAIKLLQHFSYDEKLVDRTKEMLKYFEEHHEWMELGKAGN